MARISVDDSAAAKDVCSVYAAVALLVDKKVSASVISMVYLLVD